ncbi:hypothetical protein [Vibrio phage vB_VmeM-Yong XC32]|nr:hypothetical protein [Vibrio phage vB_VmeM-Yong XC31]QAX96528.1 hypothetical protein [Vibrio phage vB_VmeM-Yong XC32]QAX96846.1 hypothetical protein [Vibrio phage vB_VmeM-Yong MS31]QAX97151.1 hypothetical protein [Vibrio phage vB_VmeM-Yong MS32]
MEELKPYKRPMTSVRRGPGKTWFKQMDSYRTTLHEAEGNYERVQVLLELYVAYYSTHRHSVLPPMYVREAISKTLPDYCLEWPRWDEKFDGNVMRATIKKLWFMPYGMHSSLQCRTSWRSIPLFLKEVDGGKSAPILDLEHPKTLEWLEKNVYLFGVKSPLRITPWSREDMYGCHYIPKQQPVPPSPMANLAPLAPASLGDHFRVREHVPLGKEITLEEAIDLIHNKRGIVKASGYTFFPSEAEGGSYYSSAGTYPGCLRAGAMPSKEFLENLASKGAEFRQYSVRDVICKVGYYPDPYDSAMNYHKDVCEDYFCEKDMIDAMINSNHPSTYFKERSGAKAFWREYFNRIAQSTEF